MFKKKGLPKFQFNFLIFYIIFSSCVYSYDKDPLLQKPDERKSATLDIPAGMIIDFYYPFYQSDLEKNSNTNIKESLHFGIHFFYDVYQVGFQSKNYGNMLILTSRDLERDCYSGWYLEYGANTISATREFLTNSGIDTNNVEISGPSIGIGYIVRTGFNKYPSFQFIFDLSFGQQTNKVTLYYFNLEFGLGARIPVKNHALSLDLYYNFRGNQNTNGFIYREIAKNYKYNQSSGNYDHNYYEFNERTTKNAYTFIYGFGIRASYAFNLDLIK